MRCGGALLERINARRIAVILTAAACCIVSVRPRPARNCVALACRASADRSWWHRSGRQRLGGTGLGGGLGGTGLGTGSGGLGLPSTDQTVSSTTSSVTGTASSAASTVTGTVIFHGRPGAAAQLGHQLADGQRPQRGVQRDESRAQSQRAWSQRHGPEHSAQRRPAGRRAAIRAERGRRRARLEHLAACTRRARAAPSARG